MSPAMVLAVMQAQPSAPLATDTVVSVALVIVLVGATAKLASTLSRMEEKLDGLRGVPERLTRVEGEVGNLRVHVENLEGDVNNLWAAVRRDPDSVTRRDRGPHRSRPETEGE